MTMTSSSTSSCCGGAVGMAIVGVSADIVVTIGMLSTISFAISSHWMVIFSQWLHER